MHKIWLIFLVMVTSLLASETETNKSKPGTFKAPLATVSSTLMSIGDKVELYAIDIEAKGTAIEASGDVLVLHDDQYISADRATFNRETGDLELHGHIMMMQGAQYFAMADDVFINLNDNVRKMSPFYLTDRTTRLWVGCENALAVDNKFQLDKGHLSGCDPTDPTWEIYFSSADWNSESQWMNVYNPRFHIMDVPVLYLPYIGYPTDNTRRTGLLRPNVGISSSEGFFYEQPIYIAESPSWDVELKPQVRTSRGYGISGALRFVDSNASYGEITLGGFKEMQSYVDEYQLAHSTDFGFSVDYANEAVLNNWFDLDLEGQSGFYVNANWMNSVDYQDVTGYSDSSSLAGSSQVLSRANLFYNTDNNYIGEYLKYYQDLAELNNDNTLQNISTTQYHHYLETWFDDHLMSNVDARLNHLYRPQGAQADRINVNLPLKVQTPVFDDYVVLSYEMLVNGRAINFSNDQSAVNAGIDYQSGQYYRGVQTFGAESQMTRGFKDVTHVMGFSANYNKVALENRNGFYEATHNICDPNAADYNASNDLCNFYDVTDIQEATYLGFSNYLFDDEGKQRLYDRLTQTVSHNSGQTLGELQNELDVLLTDAFSFTSDSYWNHQDMYFSKQVTGIRFNDEALTLGLSYLYEDKRRRNTELDTKYLTSNISYQYNSHYKYFGAYDYDFVNKINQRAEIGFLYSKRCWDFGIRYVENNTPILTTSGQSSMYEKTIFFSFNFKPIGGAELDYMVEKTNP
jgi:LPS-assembly protein